MVRRRIDLTTKRRVWRVTPNAPQGEYVDADDLPRESAKALDRPEPGWALSSFELTHGLDVSEAQDTVPADLMDELFKKP